MSGTKSGLCLHVSGSPPVVDGGDRRSAFFEHRCGVSA